MSQKSNNVLQFILGFIAFIFLGWLAYATVKIVIGFFKIVNPNLGAALVAASATLIVSVLSVLVSRSLEQRVNIAKEIREKKVPIYEELIEFVFKILKGTKTETEISQEEIINFMYGFVPKLIVWGSDDVLEAFYKFRTHSQQNNSTDILFVVENLLLAIRKDLGHKNKGMTKGKILSLFVNDMDKYVS